MLEPNEENMLFTLNFFVLNVKVRMKGTERKTCRAGKGQLSDPQNKLETFSFLERRSGAEPERKENFESLFKGQRAFPSSTRYNFLYFLKP